jgi:hypothetical protein
MKKEIWKPVMGWGNKYQVSDHGRVRIRPDRTTRFDPAECKLMKKLWDEKRRVVEIAEIIGTYPAAIYAVMRYQGPETRGRVLKPGKDRLGRHQYILQENFRRRPCRGHQLVAEAFLGPKPKGKMVHHKDGNPSNNHVSNLEYVTCRENVIHGKAQAIREGRPPAGMKLTLEDAKQIKFWATSGMPLAALEHMFGVSRNTIWRIRNGKSWAIA